MKCYFLKKNFFPAHKQLSKFRLNFRYLLQPDILFILEDTAGYVGLLLAPAGGFGRGLFSGKKKKKAYYTVLAYFWQFLVPSSNLSNF